VIRAQGVTKLRGAQKVLDGLELEATGRVLVVVGPSGGGLAAPRHETSRRFFAL
jgi:ABC-type transporter Mla maintaining outer membrane lipid asymmetry ATPase subunit MlaF